VKRAFFDIAQNSDEWDELRLGRFTASTFKYLFMGKSTKGYLDALYAPVHERKTGDSVDGYYGGFMARGHELEPYTVEEYEMETFNEVRNGGFFTLGDWLGASPDGLVGDDGLLEGKAPKYNTFIGYMLSGELPKIYKWQVYGQMYITDRDWVDFVAYHPGYDLLKIRVHRDEKIEKELESVLNESIEKAQEIISKLTNDTSGPV